MIYNNEIKCRSCGDRATIDLLIMCEGESGDFESARSGVYCDYCAKNRITTIRFDDMYTIQHHRPI